MATVVDLSTATVSDGAARESAADAPALGKGLAFEERTGVGSDARLLPKMSSSSSANGSMKFVSHKYCVSYVANTKGTSTHPNHHRARGRVRALR